MMSQLTSMASADAEAGTTIKQPVPSHAKCLRVAAGSSPSAVAGAIAGSMREHGDCELQAIGAGAVNQAVKAVAIARGFMVPGGADLTMIPAFSDIEVNGEERTSIRLLIGFRRENRR